MHERNSFPLALYVLFVFALSWPAQIAARWLVDRNSSGHAFDPTTLLIVPMGLPTLFHRQDWVCVLNSISMVMVGVGTVLTNKLFVRHRGTIGGWRWGNPRHYALAFTLVLLIWLHPCIAAASGKITLRTDRTVSSIVRLLALGLATFAPALCAEYGWRGHLLPNFLERMSVRRAILLHCLIWWAWFLPSTVGVAIYAGVGASAQGTAPIFISVPVAIALVLVATLVPAVAQGVILSHFRLTSGSLLVPAVYYTLFECVRDSLGSSKSLSPLAVELWAHAAIIGTGLLLFWRADWQLDRPLRRPV
jgi:Type II CAAX prenyl endopeptidase Rce1-like